MQKLFGNFIQNSGALEVFAGAAGETRIKELSLFQGRLLPGFVKFISAQICIAAERFAFRFDILQFFLKI